MKIYLARHGETIENVAGIYQGHLPGQLTTRGISQVETLSSKLEGVHFDYVICSDLQRCKDTVSILTGHLPSLPATIFTDKLRERNWGTITGRKIADIPMGLSNNAESLKAMRERARQFLVDLKKKYPNKRVLIVSHGMFCRYLEAQITNIDVANISTIGNAEYRVFNID